MAQIEIRLYFGRSINGSYGISEPDFSDFLRDVVTPRFNSFTVTQGVGHWVGDSELSTVVSIITEDDPTVRYSATKIATLFNARFKQEAVLVQYIPCTFELVTAHKPGWVAPEDRIVTVQGHDDLHNHYEPEPAVA